MKQTEADESPCVDCHVNCTDKQGCPAYAAWDKRQKREEKKCKPCA